MTYVTYEMTTPNYQKMYAVLCGGISDALDNLPFMPATEAARQILEEALDEAEEMYLQE